jgi:hypothetical protein
MSKTKPKHDPKSLPIPATPSQTPAQSLSRAALVPSINAASVIEAYQGNIMGKDCDLAEMVECLRETIKEVKGGDLTRLEAMLVSQATALQTMFTSLARRAANQQQLRQFETFMALALKAQAQSRATVSALVDLKYPRQATFVKQANIAHGPQQVNNGAAPPYATSTHATAHAGETKPAQTELLERQHGERMDTGKTGTAGGADPHMEAVEAVHRPQNTRR